MGGHDGYGGHDGRGAWGARDGRDDAVGEPLATDEAAGPADPAGAPAAPPGAADARFLTALDRLASAWLLWLIVPDIAIPVEVAGRTVGLEPATWILTPLVLVPLIQMRAAVPAPTGRAFVPVLAAAGVTAAVDVARSLASRSPAPAGDLASALGLATWSLAMVDLGLFSRAMVRWTATRASGPGAAQLGRAWRRSARWAWTGLAATAGLGAARAVQLLVSGGPVTGRWTIEGPGWVALPVVAGMAALLLGPVLSVAGSTAATRRARERPGAGHRRPVPAAGTGRPPEP